MLRRSTGDWPSCSARERLARPRQSAAGWSVCAPASCARLRISPTASTGRGRTMTVKDPTTYLRSTPTPQTLRGVISLLKNLYTYDATNDIITIPSTLNATGGYLGIGFSLITAYTVAAGGENSINFTGALTNEFN